MASAGVHNYCEDWGDAPGVQETFIQRVMAPPEYSNVTLEADYAVIEFEDAFRLDPNHVMPACLPTGRPISGTLATVSGWGKISGERHLCFLVY